MDTFTGEFTWRITDSDYDSFVGECNKAKGDGYYLKKATVKRMWPMFWIKRYKAKFVKPFVSDWQNTVFHEPLQLS